MAVDSSTPTVDRTAMGQRRAANSRRSMCSAPANSMKPSIPFRNACFKSICWTTDPAYCSTRGTARPTRMSSRDATSVSAVAPMAVGSRRRV